MGAELRLKMRRGGTVRYGVVGLEPGRLLAIEARFPAARLGHEHRLEPAGSGVEVTHRVYLRGPLWVLWALMLGRKRMRESIVRFAERERELAAR